MKKISIFLFTAVLVIAFTACNGAKKAEAPAATSVENDSIENVVATTDSVVATESTAPTLSPAEMLKDFQAYVKAYGEAYNSIAKDPTKFTDLSSQSQKRVGDMEQIKNQLSAKQQQDYQKALSIILQINNRGK